MTLQEIISKPEYEFLKSNPHLGNKICLLGVGGSVSYGTNIPGKSDLDIRGITVNSRADLLGLSNFENLVEQETDTTVYGLNKIFKLLLNANPNVLELLGLKPEHYLYINYIGKELIRNRKLFLSKRVIHSFGGYSSAQLRRLDNKAVRLVNQSQREQHILNSIKNAFYTFPDRYFTFSEDNIRLYIDKSLQEEYDTEIYMDVELTHYPLRDYKGMWAEMNNIVKDYSKIGKRNKHAIEHEKLGKHMMHLIRLYMMCIDILEKEEIITYREQEHDLLMDIRNGKYLDDNKQPIPEFYEMVEEYEKRMEYAKENTSLPETPNEKEAEELLIHLNEMALQAESYEGFKLSL